MLHLLLVTVVPGCLFAGWWQVNRALSGNLLSYFYSLEWPLFAVLGVIAWWQLMHDVPVPGQPAEEVRTQARSCTATTRCPAPRWSGTKAWRPPSCRPTTSTSRAWPPVKTARPGVTHGVCPWVPRVSEAPGRLGGTAGALARYRVMALVVGTGLAVLCFVGIPLQVAGILVTGHNKWPWTVSYR